MIIGVVLTVDSLTAVGAGMADWGVIGFQAKQANFVANSLFNSQ